MCPRSLIYLFNHPASELSTLEERDVTVELSCSRKKVHSKQLKYHRKEPVISLQRRRKLTSACRHQEGIVEMGFQNHIMRDKPAFPRRKSAEAADRAGAFQADGKMYQTGGYEGTCVCLLLFGKIVLKTYWAPDYWVRY